MLVNSQAQSKHSRSQQQAVTVSPLHIHHSYVDHTQKYQFTTWCRIRRARGFQFDWQRRPIRTHFRCQKELRHKTNSTQFSSLRFWSRDVPRTIFDTITTIRNRVYWIMSDDTSISDHATNEKALNAVQAHEASRTPKIIRVLTVCAYLITVSTAAIMLSAYYIFLWNPTIQTDAVPVRQH